MHIMKLEKEYFDAIKSGEKVKEVRLNDEKRQLLKVGDKILFKNMADTLDGVVVEVTGLQYFNSFKEMAQVVSLKSIGMEGKNCDQVQRIYRKFYSTEDEKKYGVVVIHMKLFK